MAFWQTFLVVLYGFFINWDKEGPKIGTSQPVVAGFLTDLLWEIFKLDFISVGLCN